jgi:hypothetical protein
MRTYRLELILNERDLIEFLDQNPGYKPTVEGIANSDTSAVMQDAPELYRPTTRKPRGRRKRTVETLQAAAE